MGKKRIPRKESFTVAIKIKTYVRAQGYYAEADLPDAVSQKVVDLLNAAMRRTASNGRKTVRSEDL